MWEMAAWWGGRAGEDLAETSSEGGVGSFVGGGGGVGERYVDEPPGLVVYCEIGG